MQRDALKRLNADVIACRRCPRLVAWREEVARKKVRRFADWSYWGKPVPGFGDPNAWLLIIGLAPAAHGANRTGRMFTGDDSGNWLYRALNETGFANQPSSTSIDDGLKLTGCYITATCRCAPPQNKVTADEISNCSSYLLKELKLLKSLSVILCLGRIAFDSFCRLYGLKGLQFGHNLITSINLSLRGRNDRGNPEQSTLSLRGAKQRSNPDLPTVHLITSYHPSRQNTQTGKLKWREWMEVFEKIQRYRTSLPRESQG